MSIKDQINTDLKKAMLEGQKDLVTTLRGLKSAILYAEVASNMRTTGLADKDIMSLLQKEAKKRQESADLYRQGGNQEKALQEETEKTIIERYLPAQLSESELNSIVEEVISSMGTVGAQDMGRIIGAVKQRCKGNADGATIARLVKDRIH